MIFRQITDIDPILAQAKTRKMRGLILSTLFFFTSVASSWATPVSMPERALIAVVNLSIRAKNHKALYRHEETRALKKILRTLGGSYGKMQIFSDKEATRVNLLSGIEKFENDATVRAIDVIIYIHGEGETLGFVDTPDYYPSAKLKDDILALRNINGESPKKLRVLYSDACYGALHMKDWVGAGFHVATGSAGVDSNWSMDLKKFMKGWRRRETFARSIRRANHVLLSPLMDLFTKDGDSYKYMLGDSTVRIDTPVD